MAVLTAPRTPLVPGVFKAKVKVSFGSIRLSSRSVTVTVLFVSPSAKLSVPLAAVKSAAALAVPAAVAYFTLVAFVAPLRTTVNVTFVAFSATLTALVVSAKL